MTVGSTLGPYRIDRELGSGGMGKVFRATTVRKAAGLEPETAVALKIVHTHLTEAEGFFKRFLREGEIGKSVRHENVVRTYDCDALGGQMFLVMEYVEGQTLRDLLTELERVPEDLCRHIGREVAKGLAAIHAAGAIHRDMKPENVLITADHVVKVMDLGVARLNDESLRLSQTGAFVGSIHYAAPECFSEGGKQVDSRADLHALGLVLYELACGTNPYYADTVPEILKRILHEEPRRLGDVNPQLSPFIEEVVHCLLAKKPDERFADAATLLGVLEEGEKSDWWRARAKAIQAVTHQPLRRIRIPRETAVYGREADLAKLRALYERAKAGEGQVVLIEGEAGIGKSRVVDELIGRLQRDGEDLNFLFGSYPPGGAATASGAFSTAFREQFGDADLAESLRERLGVAHALAPAFAALLQGTAPPTGAEQLTKDSLQTCFVSALRSLAADRTTVLLVDDLHFATEDARTLFTSLALAVPGHRIVLVGTTRPGIDEKWLAGLTRLPQTSQTALHRLGPKDLIQLLRDSLKSEALATSLAAQIALKSDGNPFFVFEIIRGLRDGQFLTQRDDGTWVSTRVIDDIKIPSSILDLVNARVADLTEDERNLLDVAACWGFEFDPLLVGEVLGIARIPLLRMLGQVERQHRLVRSSGLIYVFDHHQVQEALYGSLSELLRREYHAALAAALETRSRCTDKDTRTLDGALCVDLCEHFLKGAQGERAVRHLDAAHVHLVESYLHEAALRLAESALAVPGLLVGADRAKALLRISGVHGPLERLGRSGRREEALREAAELAESSGDAELRAWARFGLGVHLYDTGRLAEAESVCRDTLATAQGRGDGKLEGNAANVLGLVCKSQGRLTEAREHFERILAHARDTGNRHNEAVATVNTGIVLHEEGRLDEAKETYDRALAINREVGDRWIEAVITRNVGNVLCLQGRLQAAQERFERSLAIAREIGARGGEAHAMAPLGNVFWSQGRLAEADAWYARSLAMSREVGDRVLESQLIGNLGNVLAARGRLAEAKEHFERQIAACREIGHRSGEALAQHNVAEVLRHMGDAPGCEERYLASRAVYEAIGDRRGAASVHLGLGSLHSEIGEAESARGSLTTARDLARATGAVGDETHARCELALLPGGDPRDALAAYAEHEERLSAATRLEARFLLWRATGDRAHLAAAKRLLDDSMAQLNAEDREPALANLRLHREIVAAAKAEGIS